MGPVTFSQGVLVKSYNHAYGMHTVQMIRGLPTSMQCPECGVWFNEEVEDDGEDVVCPCCYHVFSLRDEEE